ncbi:hypothetical protein QE370_000320 [Aeromicrobium sp. SORGH_AS981]|uniref:DUF4244 domain-containing protein n=1 Tax=Aeromicrobium sp. SORGH_AS_0981 TaxID=3041802 RepID=UPI00285EA933|nr:DUF4244 domain-containing protein [Aeromicrobium sp. SORGH_AS_0981]MDR6117136.1 hypothetical protein [Aeromicrobium sp. SORGH_AS_0981]
MPRPTRPDVRSTATPDVRRRVRPRVDRGATTAEYAVGTLGAVTCAAVLLRLGADGWFLDHVAALLRRALEPRSLLELLWHGRPFAPLR